MFLPALGNGLLAYDDLAYTIASPVAGDGLTARLWIDVFRTPRIDSWIPLTVLSHALCVELFGADPVGHHLVNNVLHAAAAGLWFLFLRTVPVRPWIAALVAVAWAVHPLRVESVAWVAERKDVLSGAAFLVLLLCWSSWGRTQRKRWLWGALGAWVFVLLAKPLVAAPFLLLLLDVWPLRRRPTIALAVEKLPFFLLAAFASVMTLVGMAEGRQSPQLDLADRLANAPVSWVRYVQKTGWPSGLASPYPFPDDSWPPLVVAGAVSLLVAVSVVAVRARRRRPSWFVGWFWFLGMSFPTIGVVGFGNAPLADRFTYVPSLGLFLIAATALERALSSSNARRTIAARVLVGAILAAWALLTVRQIGVWRDTTTLFAHALAVDADNQSARYHLAEGRLHDGDPAGAAALVAAVPVERRAPGLHRLHGQALLRMNEPRAAVEAFVEALSANERDCAAHEGLARALRAVGDAASAAAEEKRARACRGGAP